MHLSTVSITQFGVISIRHAGNFDRLVLEAQNAGMDVHPCVNARNWIVRPQGPSRVTAMSVSLNGEAGVNDVRAALAVQGLRPCTPHETLCIAIDKIDDLKVSDSYHVALDRIWSARDGEAALNVFRISGGQLHVGTSPTAGTWPAKSGWRFLAAAIN